MYDRSAAPHLDHIFITIGAEALDAITRCETLASERLGRFRIKDAESTLLGPYRTVNVLGESTFVEFFPESAPPFPGVSLGMVLSFDHVGEAISARQALASRGIAVEHELVRRKVPDEAEPQPWYHLSRPDVGEGSPFTLFLSEITPEYFTRIGAQFGPGGRQNRSAYLKAALKAAHGDTHLMRDIAGVVIRLRPGRAQLLAAILDTLGYAATEQRDCVTLAGPEACIRIVPDADAAEGLLSLDLSLRSPDPAPGRVLSFGRDSALTFSPSGIEDASARWTFTPSLLSM